MNPWAGTANSTPATPAPIRWLAGLVLGLASVRYIESLFYQVKATDPAMLAIPSVVIVAAALVAALPAVIHAVRIDPGTMLRSE
jgi:putative ABC transport system permease protein